MLESLPPELIHTIALSGHLSPPDVRSLSLTCTTLAAILTHDPYAHNLHRALLGVLPNTCHKRFQAAIYALNRRWFAPSVTPLYLRVANTTWTSDLELSTPDDVAGWERVVLAALSLSSCPPVPLPSSHMDTSLLHIAACVGAPNLTSYILSNTSAPSEWMEWVGMEGTTPLFAAALGGHCEVVSLLLDAGDNVNSQCNRSSTTALHAASWSNHAETVSLLLSHGANPNAAMYGGFPPLYSAAQAGHAAIISILLAASASPTQPARNGYTPLHAAAQTGHVSAIQTLLEESQDLDVNVTSHHNTTALFLAASRGHASAVSCLLTHNADPTIGNQRGATPLHIAAQNNHPSVVSLLLTSSLSIDVDCTTRSHHTSLYLAVEKDHPAMVDLLLSHGADPNVASKKGWTPLHVAVCQSPNEAIISSLLSHDADLDVFNKRGMTPLHMVSQSGHSSIASLLLEAGASTSVRNKRGVTPLFLAAQRGNIDCLDALIRAGADVNADRDCGDTDSPLYIAVQAGHTQVVARLQEAGVIVDDSSLQLARERQLSDIVAILEQ